MNKTAIIIGAGPAGLTAAYELALRTDITPIIVECSNEMGGLSRTVEYKGNRLDIGGHRFFSKSDKIMKWWQNMLPAKSDNDNCSDNIMLVRERLSRIYFLDKFFDYPVSVNRNTILNLGFWRVIKIGFSYLSAKIFFRRRIDTLEQFFISRFGKELYKTFFKDYTEKVWGIPCSEIPAEWGAQRVKKLSVARTILHSLRNSFPGKKSLKQKNTETSLIERFLYPKYGPGQMWETVARLVEEKGGKILRNCTVDEISISNNLVTEIGFTNNSTGKKEKIKAEYILSSMPVNELIEAMNSEVPGKVKTISRGLLYRDFITVGLLLNKLKIKDNKSKNPKEEIKDHWIYIQDKSVKIGRLQIFNNWSPTLVADKSKVWIGLEYFCNQGDDLWNKSDSEFIRFAVDELSRINIIESHDVIDATIIRVPKAYPAYFGSYKDFEVVRNFTDTISNLFLIGRNGMHRYNNQDHSMLTAMAAVHNIIDGIETKENIWAINSEEEYHEER